MVISQITEIGAVEVTLTELRHMVQSWRSIWAPEKSEGRFGEQPEKVKMRYAMQVG